MVDDFLNLELLIILQSYALRVGLIRIIEKWLNMFHVNLTVTVINKVLDGELVGVRGLLDNSVRSLPG
jgi:hypothetical protein